MRVRVGPSAPALQPAPRPPTPRPVDRESLRRAIEDLVDTFGQRYPQGKRYLARLDQIEQVAGDARAEQLAALQREALIANPLVSNQPILFVTRHQYRSHYHAIDTLFHTGEFNPDRGFMHADLFQGGGAMKTIDLRTGEIKTLVEVPEGIARDPDIHFDGRRIVFAMRRSKAEDYHIYEIAADGSGLWQLTRAEGVCDFDPIYLPDDTVVFSSTRDLKSDPRRPCVGARHRSNRSRSGWGLVHFSAERRVLRENHRPKTWTCPLPRSRLRA